MKGLCNFLAIRPNAGLLNSKNIFWARLRCDFKLRPGLIASCIELYLFQLNPLSILNHLNSTFPKNLICTPII